MNDIVRYSKKLKLLYVEDNKDLRESTEKFFQTFFDNIIVAIDGEDGYNKFTSNSIDLIITDMRMPNVDGLEMIEKIRDINKEIPILALSAHNETNYLINCIKLGVDGYLLKPLDSEQFLTVLSKIIEKVKLKDEVANNINFLKQYEDATNNSSIVSKTDLYGIITYVNDEFCKISGYTKEELVGKNHNIIRHPDNPREIYKKLWKTIKVKKEIFKSIIRNIAKDGRSYYVKTTIKPILDKDNNIIEYIALRDNITDIMNPKKQLDDAIQNANEPVVVYLKLDDFETLEEFYGNETVEKIQDKISIYLESNLPEDCKFERVYQLGHGEYVLFNEKSVCFKDKDENSFLSHLKLFQDKVKSAVIEIEDVDYDMSLIISVAYNSNNILESSKIGIKRLIKTKQSFIVSNNFAQIEYEKAQKNMNTIAMVKKAINDFKIVSYFQPIINNKTKQIEKYESLVRLINEDGDILSPYFFLDTAKKGKYYSAITNMVLDNSFKALKDTEMSISINLSALDIEQKSTRDKIFELLEDNKEHSSRIIIELLEDESIKDFKIITSFISNVKKFGVKIAIDDFGAGYSNFERLIDYQPDILKIDGCLVRDIETNDYSHCVVKTIVSFAKEQNIQTVAEYVENEEIFNILNDLGVDYSQGYYFGKPETLK